MRFALIPIPGKERMVAQDDRRSATVINAGCAVGVWKGLKVRQSRQRAG